MKTLVDGIGNVFKPRLAQSFCFLYVLRIRVALKACPQVRIPDGTAHIVGPYHNWGVRRECLLGFLEEVLIELFQLRELSVTDRRCHIEARFAAIFLFSLISSSGCDSGFHHVTRWIIDHFYNH